MPEQPTITIHPLTAERWADLEALFGPRGATGGCWCMFFRRPYKEYEASKGEGNKAALKALAGEGREPGLIAYVDGTPAGWVSMAPLSEYVRLATSRIAAPLDERPAWAVVCFYIGRQHRGLGLMRALLDAAVQYAAEHGAQVVEGYPVEPKTGDAPAVFMYHGVASVFREAGFEEVARRTEGRPTMRYEVR